MRRLAPILCLVAASLCKADASIKSSPGLVGVSYTRIESQELTADELKTVQFKATADVAVLTKNMNAPVGKPVMVKSTHTACFSTWLTTNADYNFLLDIGGLQATASERIVIPARHRTCVTKELYRQVTFAGRGNFMYSATSTGTTALAGRKEARSSAWIFAR